MARTAKSLLVLYNSLFHHPLVIISKVCYILPGGNVNSY